MAGTNGNDLADTIYAQALERVAQQKATEMDRLVVMNYEVARQTGKKLDRLVALVEGNPKTLREHVQDKGPWAAAGAALTGAALYLFDHLVKKGN